MESLALSAERDSLARVAVGGLTGVSNGSSVSAASWRAAGSMESLCEYLPDNPLAETFKSFWVALNAAYTDEQLVVAGSFIVHEMLYFLYCVPDFIFQFIPYMDRYRIQPTKKVPLREQWKCFQLLMFNHFFIHLPVMMLFMYNGAKSVGATFTYDTMPRWYVVVARVLCMLVAEDTWHYWGHRFMHHPRVYKHVHKTHHDFKVPFGLTAEYSHPVDYLLVGAGNGLAMHLFANHLMVLFVYTAARLWVGVVSHSGYDIKWINPLYLMPGYAGVRPHDFHHEKARGNFASTFTWWDKLCGTYLDNEILSERLKKYKEF